MALPVSDEQRARFEENLAFLRSFHPTLFNKLKIQSEEPSFEIASEKTFTINLGGRYVESRYGTEQDTSSVGDKSQPGNQITGESRGPIIFMGSGLGYHINRRCTAGNRGFLVEKDVTIFRAALYIIEPEILRSLILFIAEDVSAVEKTLSQHGEAGIAVVEHGRSMQFHRAYYKQVRKAVENVIGASIASSTTTQATMKVWLKNVLRNLLLPDHVRLGSAPLQGAFQGPVMLVSSGPFLEEVSDDLRRWSRNIPLLALLPSVPYLQSCDISPDFVVTTDAGFWNRYRFIRDTRLPLITTFSADPALLRSWNGVSILFSHDLPVEGLFASIGGSSLTVPMQGTASLVMLLLARLMGFTDIYLAGYDFSFTGLKDHLRGAGFESFMQQSVTRTNTWETKMLDRLHVDRLIAVHDCLGGTVFSTHKLLLYRNWFERELDLTGIRRLNRGVEIRGIDTVSTDHMNAYGRGIREAFQQRMKNLTEVPIQRKRVVDDAQHLLGYIEETQDTTSKMHMHTALFGPGTGTLDEASVTSDLLFVQRQLSKLMERLT